MAFPAIFNRAVCNCRAAALISRDWVGDAMWALKDCEAALRLDSSLAKAHYRRIQALKAMNQIQVSSMSDISRTADSDVVSRAVL